jgi:gluconolactonase
MPTNICFGGADMRDAWITGGAGGTLIKARWPRPGARLAFNA